MGHICGHGARGQNARRGLGLVSSSDGDDDTRFAKAERILGESELEVVERIELAHHHQEQHVVFHVRQTAESG